MLLITHANVITVDENDRLLEDAAIAIEDGVIRAIETTAVLEADPRWLLAPRLDARGQYAMPGSICAHTHFYGAFARGMAIPGAAPHDFPSILSRLWWNLDKVLDRDAVRLSALVSLVDAVKHGTTTLFDHHASPNAIDGSLDVIADAVDRAGVRAVLCYEVTDRDGRERMEAGIAENLRFMRAARTRSDGRLAGTFGLHASLTLSDETLRQCAEANPAGEGFHIHLAEHEADQHDSTLRYRKRAAHRLADHGILGGKSIAAHGVHLDDDEIETIRASGTWLTHQPRSNMNNAVGAMPFDAMMAEDVRVCLGNDGFSNAMWEEWKAAYFLHKVAHRDPRLANGADVARVALKHNAALAQQWFGDRLGELSVGAPADVILVDYHPFTPLTTGNLPWHIIFGFESSMVTTTIAAGAILMRDRVLVTLDEAAIAAEARAIAPDVWARYQRLATG